MLLRNKTLALLGTVALFSGLSANAEPWWPSAVVNYQNAKLMLLTKALELRDSGAAMHKAALGDSVQIAKEYSVAYEQFAAAGPGEETEFLNKITHRYLSGKDDPGLTTVTKSEAYEEAKQRTFVALLDRVVASVAAALTGTGVNPESIPKFTALNMEAGDPETFIRFTSAMGGEIKKRLGDVKNLDTDLKAIINLTESSVTVHGATKNIILTLRQIERLSPEQKEKEAEHALAKYLIQGLGAQQTITVKGICGNSCIFNDRDLATDFSINVVPTVVKYYEIMEPYWPTGI